VSNSNSTYVIIAKLYVGTRPATRLPVILMDKTHCVVWTGKISLDGGQ